MWKFALLLCSLLSTSSTASISPEVPVTQDETSAPDVKASRLEPRHILHHLLHHHMFHKQPHHEDYAHQTGLKFGGSVAAVHAESSGFAGSPSGAHHGASSSANSQSASFGAAAVANGGGHRPFDDYEVSESHAPDEVPPTFSKDDFQPQHHGVNHGVIAGSSANAASLSGGMSASAASEAEAASKSFNQGDLGSGSSLSFSQTHSFGGKGASASFSLSKSLNIG